MRQIRHKKMDVFFFKTEIGSEPVREWLWSLNREERTIIGEDIKTVQYGFPIGMPLVRPMGEGLYEVRSRLINTIARVLFCVIDRRIVLLHGFIKKSQQTPKADLELARKRYKLVRGGK